MPLREAGVHVTLEERVKILEELVYYLLALEYRRSRMFVTTMPDGTIGKEELDKLKERLPKKQKS